MINSTSISIDNIVSMNYDSKLTVSSNLLITKRLYEINLFGENLFVTINDFDFIGVLNIVCSLNTIEGYLDNLLMQNILIHEILPISWSFPEIINNHKSWFRNTKIDEVLKK